MDFKNRGYLFALLVVVAALVGNAAAATYVVGDILGWRVPNTPADYSNWATHHVFSVGDVLVFNFMTGQHSVAQMTKAAFDRCSSTNPISLATVGPSNATLSSVGQNYYICTFGTHCSLGQKLAINVSASSASPTPAPTPSSPIAPAPTPSPLRSPSLMPYPESSPSPAPSGSDTPQSPAALEPLPDSITPPKSLNPPPPPSSSAVIPAISASLVGFALVAIRLLA